MPTYEYKCGACKHEFEAFHSIKDKPLKKCPKCGKSALERLIGTGGAIIFKGSGFYQTDYRSESYKKGAAAEKPAEAKTDGKSEPAKSEAKAESKAAPAAAEKPKKAEPKEKKAKAKGE
jgi:putative FmdB family regulatory protein